MNFFLKWRILRQYDFLWRASSPRSLVPTFVIVGAELVPVFLQMGIWRPRRVTASLDMDSCWVVVAFCFRHRVNGRARCGISSSFVRARPATSGRLWQCYKTNGCRISRLYVSPVVFHKAVSKLYNSGTGNSRTKPILHWVTVMHFINLNLLARIHENVLTYTSG